MSSFAIGLIEGAHNKYIEEKKKQLKNAEEEYKSAKDDYRKAENNYDPRSDKVKDALSSMVYKRDDKDKKDRELKDAVCFYSTKGPANSVKTNKKNHPNRDNYFEISRGKANKKRFQKHFGGPQGEDKLAAKKPGSVKALQDEKKAAVKEAFNNFIDTL